MQRVDCSSVDFTGEALVSSWIVVLESDTGTVDRFQFPRLLIVPLCTAVKRREVVFVLGHVVRFPVELESAVFDAVSVSANDGAQEIGVVDVVCAVV